MTAAKKGVFNVDYSQITDQIYIGTNYCCQLSFDKGLLDEGITADISLEKEHIDNATGADFFVWLPTIDRTAPSLQQIGLGIQALDYFVKNKIKVYVHCEKGHGRAPTLVAAYFISQGMTKEVALKTIANRRPEIHLEKVQLALLTRLAKKNEK